MALHVNIGAAKTRLSELVAAAVAGQDIVLDKAGEPQVRLVPIEQDARAADEERARSRRSALGMYKHLVGGRDIDVNKIKAEDREYQEGLDAKYGSSD